MPSRQSASTALLEWAGARLLEDREFPSDLSTEFGRNFAIARGIFYREKLKAFPEFASSSIEAADRDLLTHIALWCTLLNSPLATEPAVQTPFHRALDRAARALLLQ